MASSHRWASVRWPITDADGGRSYHCHKGACTIRGIVASSATAISTAPIATTKICSTFTYNCSFFHG